MKTTQEKIAIMQAFVDGKTIEVRGLRSSDTAWWPLEKELSVVWSWGTHDYRIKEDMEQKALELYAETLGIPKHIFLPLETTKHGWRAVINAVKRGEIT